MKKTNKKPPSTPNSYIPIEQATAESVSKDVFNREFGWLKRELEGVNKLMIGIIIVLIIGFVTLLLQVSTMLIESWRFKSNVDQALIQSLLKQTDILEKNLNSINNQNKILKDINKTIDQIQSSQK